MFDRVFADSGKAKFPKRNDRPSSGKVVEDVLSAIDKRGNAHVFIKVFREAARDRAEELDELGSEDLPLWGTTVAVKDLIALKNHVMTGGSVVLDYEYTNGDALAVKRLKEAGAIVIGAANMHELAFGTTSINPHFGTVSNPINSDYIAGGSSGGSAAAVGFGMSDYALGTDTGGSVRIPAACCGLVGYKPSFNLLPLDGVYPLGYTLDHLGPITDSVMEAARLSEIIMDKPGALTRNITEGWLDGTKIGFPEDYFLDGIEEEVKEHFHKKLGELEREGAELIRVELPHFQYTPAVYLCTSGTEALGIHFENLVNKGSKFGKEVRIRLLANLFIPAFARVLAQRVRYHLFADLKAVFSKVDVLATPTLPVTVPRIDTDEVTLDGQKVPVGTTLLRNTSPFNLTGVPTITLPSGFDRNGLPFSFQLSGEYAGDDALLRVAYSVEKIIDWD